jgi:uncharacterized RDD family membrane protein YckC
MTKKHIIPRVSKFTGDINDVMPLATDILTASATRRVCATIIDMLVIAGLSVYALSPLTRSIYRELNSYDAFFDYLSALGLSVYVLWGIYVTVMNGSALRATLGQLVMRIYVTSVFGNRISYLVACARFLIFSAPLRLLYIVTIAEIISAFPVGFLPEYDLIRKDTEINDISYILILLLCLIQLVFLWAIMTANYSRVLWDWVLKTRVLMRTPRELQIID